MRLNERMCGRERLWCVLNGGEPDRIPWCPCVSPYYLQGHPKYPAINEIEALREMGAELLVRGTNLGVIGYVNSPEVIFRVETLDNEEHIHISTPVGDLHSILVRTPASPWMPFPKKHPVSTLDDLKVLQWIQEHRIWRPSADYTAFNAIEEEVGKEGIATVPVEPSPLQMLLEHYMGVERFYDLLLNYPAEVEAWMDLYHEQLKRFLALVAESPAQIAIGYENTSMSNLSPHFYRMYVKDRLDEYADIFHSAGKVYLNHDCGRLKGIEDMIRDGRQNGRVDVAREPTGDFDFSRRLELTGDKVIAGGIDATAFVSFTPEQMKEHVREFLREVAPGKHFILGSGDAIPMHTPPEVLRAIGELVAREGAYPLAL